MWRVQLSLTEKLTLGICCPIFPVSVVDLSGDDSGSENDDDDDEEAGGDIVVEDDSDEDSGKERGLVQSQNYIEGTVVAPGIGLGAPTKVVLRN